MKSEHILDILDGDLSEENLSLIQAHTAHCEACRQAANAARVSSALFKTAETFAPSLFFQTKVLNALRENQTLRKPLAAFWRWWQASAVMVALMLATVVGLIALTVFAPSTDANDAQAGMSTDNPYSTEAVLFNRKPSRSSDLTTEQTLEIIYETKK
ncbi:MAG: anti-sigma factor family protein [Pyrinomonadaceae bacterium]